MTTAYICLKWVLPFGAHLGISISLQSATNYHCNCGPFFIKASYIVLKRLHSLGFGKRFPVPWKPLKLVSITHLEWKPLPGSAFGHHRRECGRPARPPAHAQDTQTPYFLRPLALARCALEPPLLGVGANPAISIAFFSLQNRWTFFF